MNSENILFYSKKCKYCEQILDLVNKSNEFNKYKIICIDGNDNFPYIQRVPTLLVKEIQKPLIGINAFNHIKSKMQFNLNTNNINFNANFNLNNNDNPLLFNKSEKVIGQNIENNKYDFIENKNDTTNLQDKNDLLTLPEVGKIDETKQSKKLNALINLRTQQDLRIFGDSIDPKLSSQNNILEDYYKEKNPINSRINTRNFSTEKQSNLPNVANINNIGIETARTIVKK